MSINHKIQALFNGDVELLVTASHSGVNVKFKKEFQSRYKAIEWIDKFRTEITEGTRQLLKVKAKL